MSKRLLRPALELPALIAGHSRDKTGSMVVTMILCRKTFQSFLCAAQSIVMPCWQFEKRSGLHVPHLCVLQQIC